MAFLDAPRPPYLLLKNKTAAALATENPVLGLGEKRYETDTKKYKIGDGVTAWNSLGYGGDADAAANINDPASSTRTALNAAFVRFVDLSGNPISARRVTIKVDTTTWEIADIVAEA